MKYILGAPGSGKTKEILKLSEENRIPILCESAARKERLLQRAMQYGFVIPVPIVFSEVTAKDKVVYVDDIERLLQAMLGVKVDIVTLNLLKPDDVTTLKEWFLEQKSRFSINDFYLYLGKDKMKSLEVAIKSGSFLYFWYKFWI